MEKVMGTDTNWSVNGKHILYPDGIEVWATDGQFHRLDGPAFMNDKGMEEWWVEGKLHRLDGPAVSYPNGERTWAVKGKKHRLDGPATITADGFAGWWVDDEPMSAVCYEKTVKKIAMETCSLNKDNMQTFPFSQIESLIYAFKGWKKS
jgi:hypothetical protein